MANPNLTRTPDHGTFTQLAKSNEHMLQNLSKNATTQRAVHKLRSGRGSAVEPCDINIISGLIGTECSIFPAKTEIRRAQVTHLYTCIIDNPL